MMRLFQRRWWCRRLGVKYVWLHAWHTEKMGEGGYRIYLELRRLNWATEADVDEFYAELVRQIEADLPEITLHTEETPPCHSL